MSKEKPSEVDLLTETTINKLDEAIHKFQEGELKSIGLWTEVVNIWRSTCQQGILNERIAQEMKTRRIVLHQMTPFTLEKQGDPIRNRYDPNYWVGTIPPELRNNPELFLLDRIASLRNFFQSLFTK